MKVGVIGTGYVGLVSGTCFAELGNDVTCVDIDKTKVSKMQAGNIPIYEPGLEDLFHRNIKEKRLHFTTNIDEIMDSAIIFLALPTPPTEDGSADLSYVLGVADTLGELLSSYTVIVNKSTVPVGTAVTVRDHIAPKAKVEFDVVSNPEFLREGQAVNDFLKPDRVVIGTSSKKAKKVMEELYRPLLDAQPEKLIFTDEVTAELSKYAANGFLATKISFVNALSGLCEAVGANIDDIREVMGTDDRIGRQFLYAGPGYGGSCFPKDTNALLKIGEDNTVSLDIVRSVIETNEQQKQVIPKKILKHFNNDLNGKVFALWGLAFKDNTDDIRESPALEIIRILTDKGAKIVAFDPQATSNVERLLKDNKNLSFADDEYTALKGADALIIATNWKEFSTPNYDQIKVTLKSPVIFDGRNMYDLEKMKELDFHYESIGRPKVASVNE